MKQQGYSPKEFAEIFNISDKTVYKKIHSGMIPVYPFGKPYRIPKTYVDELIQTFTYNKEERKSEDYYLLQKLNEENLQIKDVQIQKTEKEYVVFTNNMAQYLFNVQIYKGDN